MKTLERQSPGGELIMPLSAVGLEDLTCVGGKAAHLGELTAAGLPIPRGFVITTDAWSQFIQSELRIAGWLESAESCNHQEPGALRAAVAELRRRLEEVPVPEDVAAAIAAAMTGRPEIPRAVRSSATVEDSPEASFAGQHDSFLNVCGNQEVVAAVKRCWLSLFSERAISYRRRKGIALGRAQMAVIVQELIPADASGVMFTADPASGDSDSILIEAVFGLGEAVVQGKVTPDRFVVSRSKMQVVSCDTALKRLQVVATQDGVGEQLLTSQKSAVPALTERMALRLTRLGLEVEQLLGSAVDIEWSTCKGELWLLQARAVTAVAAGLGTSFEDRQVWTNANTGEVLPDVVSPMTWSVLLPSARALAEHFLPVGSVEGREEEFISLIAGRAYFNFNGFCALGRRVPGLGKRRLDEMMGGRQEVILELKKFRLSEADLPRIRVCWWRVGARLLAFAFPFVSGSTRRGETAVESVKHANDELARIEPERLSNDELLKLIESSSMPEALKNAKAVQAFGFGFAHLFLLFGLCERWFGPDGRSRANRLLAGVGEMDTAVMGHELWEMAELAAREPELRGHLLTECTFASLKSRLEGCRGGPAFLAQWKAFMVRHGHHARGEIELFNSRWSECPDLVLNIVRGYIEAIESGHPEPKARQEALARERVDLTAQCLRELKNPLKRIIFRFVLRRAQVGSRFRENVKSEAVHQLALLRRFLLELGRRLRAQGGLENANDIFFLRKEELQGETLWNGATEVRTLVEERRAEYEQNLKITPPSVIIGRFDPCTFKLEAVDGETKVFHGIGVSAGRATGRARVLLRLDHNERVEPGEILVAPFTDPGWTPYFVAAAGIVMDLGGILSHGSIVAREYGIPAVVNVGPATQVIRTGQWLEVDADRGVVKVLDAAPTTAERETKDQTAPGLDGALKTVASQNGVA